jgi:MscS family membrane protein
VGYVLGHISRKLLSLLAARTTSTWSREFAAQLGGPITLGWTLFLVSVALPWMGLPVSSAQYGQSIIRGCFLFVLFWVFSRLVEAWGKLLIGSKWAKQRAVSNSLVTLGVRVGKICILVIAVVTLVTAMGYPAASLLAGLGVGGLAVALAAQKTLEHLFGAFAIGADEPFHEGDFIKIDDISGTVESIGLRSTRIRTPERTVVSMPNGKLSEMRVECFSFRDRLFLSCTIGLVYETTEQQMRQVLSGFEHILTSHPKIWPNDISVRFKGFGASSLNIDVAAWFLTTDWNEFLTIRQEVLLAFMNCVQQAGTSFAFPTQTIHVEPYQAKLPIRAHCAQ